MLPMQSSTQIGLDGGHQPPLAVIHHIFAYNFLMVHMAPKIL